MATPRKPGQSKNVSTPQIIRRDKGAPVSQEDCAVITAFLDEHWNDAELATYRDSGQSIVPSMKRASWPNERGLTIGHHLTDADVKMLAKWDESTCEKVRSHFNQCLVHACRHLKLNMCATLGRTTTKYLWQLEWKNPPADRDRDQSDEDENQEAQFASFAELLQESFEYVLDMKTKPDPDHLSTTRMFYYGLDLFDSLELRETPSVQAIGTEIRHLQAAVSGKQVNPNKPIGAPQVIDEIIDVFRYLFIFAIIKDDFPQWTAFPWVEHFRDGYRNASPKIPAGDILVSPLTKNALNSSCTYNGDIDCFGHVQMEDDPCVVDGLTP